MHKYKILYDNKKYFNGHIVYRIEALKDFGNVKAGDLGGYIESENNLSDEGDCWVYDNAIVCDIATVKDNAKVYDNAKIMDCAMVKENTIIYGHARIADHGFVHGSAQIYGHALIEDATIFGNTHICGYAHVCGNSVVCDDTEVYDNSVITKKAVISGNAIVCGNSYIAKATLTGNAKVRDVDLKSSKDYVFR